VKHAFAIESTRVLDLRVSCVESDDVVRHASDALSSGSQLVVMAANAEKVIGVRNDSELKRCLEQADLVLPDGIGCVIAAKLLHGIRITRVAGADTMPVLCDLSRRCGHGIFLLGGTEKVNQLAAEKLRARYPDLQIAGRQNGYFKAEDEAQIVDTINASGAKLLFVALGSPRQEKWIQANREQLKTPVIQGVGGTLDVIAGTVMRAPLLFQRMHSEWLFRLLANPTRGRRQLALLTFVWQVVREKWRLSLLRSGPQ